MSLNLRVCLAGAVLAALAACESPPKEYYNVLDRLTDVTTVVPLSAKVGDAVEVTVRGRAFLTSQSQFDPKTSTVTLGVVFIPSNVPVPYGQACPDAVVTAPPAGLNLQSGDTLTEVFNLVVKRGETVNFEHKLRVSPSKAGSYAVSGVIWGKRSDPQGPGDLESSPVAIAGCTGSAELLQVQ